MDFAYLYTSTEGRIPRSQYWAGLIVIAVVAFVLGWIIVMLLGPTLITLIVVFAVQLVLAFPAYALMAKRFQDRNKPGKYALIGIGLGLLKALLDVFGVTGNPYALNAVDYVFAVVLIIVGIWFLIELGFLRGTVGTNDYGPDPLEGR